MLLRIEGLILRGNLRHAELFEHGGKLLADHLHALPVGVAFFKLLRAALEIVEHVEKRLDGVGLGVGVGVFLLAGRALAVVVVFRGQTQILVIDVGDELGQSLHLLHLLFRHGEGRLLLGGSGGLLRLNLLNGSGLLGGGLLLFVLVLTHALLFSSPGGSCCFPNMRLRLSAK